MNKKPFDNMTEGLLTKQNQLKMKQKTILYKIEYTIGTTLKRQI